jgi:IS30 family transposase
MLRARLARLAGPVRSLTFDSGSESARHAPIESALGAKSCFAGTYCAWQLGSNENTNGLIRQYVPRSRDISTLTDTDLERIERKLNNRPRNTPGIRAPSEVRL